MKILDEIKAEWPVYKWQIIGTGLLVLAYILGLCREPGLMAIGLGLCLPLDIYLAVKEDTDTVSQWIQRQFKSKVDLVILIGSLILTGMVFWGKPATGFEVILFSVMYAIKGHLHW